MAFDELKDELNSIQDNAKAYVDTSIEYYKLKGFKIAMKSASLIARGVVALLFISLFIFFISTALALAIGKLLDSYIYGFLIVAFFYLILTSIVLFFKSKFIEKKVIQKFSKIFFND